MTYDQFIATRRWSDDLASDCPDEAWGGTTSRGWLYCGSLYINEIGDDWPDNVRAEGRWYLHLENREWVSDDVYRLEQRLFRWAVSAGYEVGTDR